MTIDLILLALVLLFGFLGASKGLSRQIAQLVALVAAVLASRPLGALFGPKLALAMNASEVVGTVAATFLAFIAVLIVVRHAVTGLLRKLLEGKSPEDRGLDRGLGFVFGAFKVLAIAYVVLSALTFVEQRVSVAGRRLGLTPRDSLSFAFAHTYNLFTWVHFAPVRDFAQVARALSHPQHASTLKKDPSVKALTDDPRFRKALASKDVQEALQRGDLPALLKCDAVLELIQDRALAARLEAAADVADRR